MKKSKIKILSVVLIVVGVISIQINTYGHSGRTDSSGGHKDNNNKSGLGSYHYHCGGHPAHLHTNGVCPYSSSSASSGSSGASSTSTPSPSSASASSTPAPSSTAPTTTETIPSTVDVIEIKINTSVTSVEVGQSKILTATITPSDATDKSITWESSDESIATISSTGELHAKNPGTVEITASTSNGKTSTIKMTIKEKPEQESNITTNTTTTNTTTSNEKDSNVLGGILTLGILGGGGYWGYKKYKK